MQFLRLIVDGEIGPLDAVKAYHAVLQRLGIRATTVVGRRPETHGNRDELFRHRHERHGSGRESRRRHGVRRARGTTRPSKLRNHPAHVRMGRRSLRRRPSRTPASTADRISRGWTSPSGSLITASGSAWDCRRHVACSRLPSIERAGRQVKTTGPLSYVSHPSALTRRRARPSGRTVRWYRAARRPTGSARWRRDWRSRRGWSRRCSPRCVTTPSRRY